MLKRNVAYMLGQEEAGTEGFKYLLSMKMWSLTENKVQDWEVPTLLLEAYFGAWNVWKMLSGFPWGMFFSNKCGLVRGLFVEVLITSFYREQAQIFDTGWDMNDAVL